MILTIFIMITITAMIVMIPWEMIITANDDHNMNNYYNNNTNYIE